MKLLKRTTAFAAITASTFAFAPSAFAVPDATTAVSSNDIVAPVVAGVCGAAAVAGAVVWGCKAHSRHKEEEQRYSLRMQATLFGMDEQSYTNKFDRVSEPSSRSLDDDSMQAIIDRADGITSEDYEYMRVNMRVKGTPSFYTGGEHRGVSQDSTRSAGATPNLYPKARIAYFNDISPIQQSDQPYVPRHSRQPVEQIVALQQQEIDARKAAQHARAEAADRRNRLVPSVEQTVEETTAWVPLSQRFAKAQKVAAIQDDFMESFEAKYHDILNASPTEYNPLVSASGRVGAARILDQIKPEPVKNPQRAAHIDSVIPLMNTVSHPSPNDSVISVEFTSSFGIVNSAHLETVEKEAEKTRLIGLTSAQAQVANLQALRNAGSHMAQIPGTQIAYEQQNVAPIKRGPGFVDVNDKTFASADFGGGAHEHLLGVQIPAVPSQPYVSSTDSISDFRIKEIKATYQTRGDMIAVEYPTVRLQQPRNDMQRKVDRRSATSSDMLRPAASLAALPII